MKVSTIEEVSEILETFDISEISDLLRKQIDLKEDSMGVIRTNYFHPLYVGYRSIIDSEEINGDVKDVATERFTTICNIFIEFICQKFQLSIDQQWKLENQDQLPGLTTAMYSFFIRDLSSNLQEIFTNYINQNKKVIFEVFEDRKNKKDASTLVKKRHYPIDLAVILANIYDTSTWIIRQLSEESYFAYMNQDYAPLRILKGLMEDGVITGSFMDTMEEVYEECIGLKGEVCFNLLSTFRMYENHDDDDE